MGIRYEKGHDFLAAGADYETYGIDEIDDDSLKWNNRHYNKIVVYKDEALRDKILSLLSGNQENE